MILEIEPRCMVGMCLISLLYIFFPKLMFLLIHLLGGYFSTTKQTGEFHLHSLVTQMWQNRHCAHCSIFETLPFNFENIFLAAARKQIRASGLLFICT